MECVFVKRAPFGKIANGTYNNLLGELPEIVSRACAYSGDTPSAKGVTVLDIPNSSKSFNSGDYDIAIIVLAYGVPTNAMDLRACSTAIADECARILNHGIILSVSVISVLGSRVETVA